jgi:putative transposase
MRKIKFSIGEYYHVYNRGVEKRDIFLENADYLKFLHSVKDSNSLTKTAFLKLYDFQPQSQVMLSTRYENLVEIICYCLMPNHFHLIIKQKVDGGISKFMHKLSTAYTMYFNLKYKRTGVLLQGPFKAKHIEGDQYLLHLSRYIHLNPLEIINGDNVQSVSFTKKYRWSSLQFYLDSKQRCLIRLKMEILINSFKSELEFANFTFNGRDFNSAEFTAIKIEK